MKLQMMKELAATKAEPNAIRKIEEDYEDVSHPNEKLLLKDDCHEEQLKKLSSVSAGLCSLKYSVQFPVTSNYHNFS